jgi:hypothetical protein
MDAMDLMALLTGGLYRTEASLCGELGLDAPALSDLAQPLFDDGLAVVWLQCPEGVAYCLTPLAIAQLELALASPPDKPWRMAGLPVVGDLAGVDVADGGMQPWELAAVGEHAARMARMRRPRADRTYPSELTLPRPTLLIGESQVWHGPGWAAARPCPGCSGAPLGSNATCLLCDRWGLDRLLPPIRAGLGRRVYAKSRLKGGVA